MVRDRRLSLTASTSASTSRSLHTDRRICYLVFATTALASSLLAHAPLSLSLSFSVSLYLEPSLLPPFSFPRGRRESGQPLFSSRIHFLENSKEAGGSSSFGKKNSLPSFGFSSPSSLIFHANKGTNAFLPSYPPRGIPWARFKYRRGSFFFSFPCKQRSSLSLSFERRNNRDRSKARGATIVYSFASTLEERERERDTNRRANGNVKRWRDIARGDRF